MTIGSRVSCDEGSMPKSPGAEALNMDVISVALKIEQPVLNSMVGPTVHCAESDTFHTDAPRLGISFGSGKTVRVSPPRLRNC
jgi:hypothetical protein